MRSSPSTQRSRPKGSDDFIRPHIVEIGFVNVFKPAGYTSAQIVARVKRIYGVYVATAKSPPAIWARSIRKQPECFRLQSAKPRA